MSISVGMEHIFDLQEPHDNRVLMHVMNFC
jgi:hypothetical protein